MNEDVLETTKKIAELKAEKARTTDEQKKAEIQATIDELEVVREVAKEQITDQY
ncbi:MAG: hypothetical protein IPK58_10655 [Acidobacteria bacterium]|nr:hypothetical protein [Acidobacteriota bacterium]